MRINPLQDPDRPFIARPPAIWRSRIFARSCKLSRFKHPHDFVLPVRTEWSSISFSVPQVQRYKPRCLLQRSLPASAMRVSLQPGIVFKTIPVVESFRVRAFAYRDSRSIDSDQIDRWTLEICQFCLARNISLPCLRRCASLNAFRWNALAS